MERRELSVEVRTGSGKGDARKLRAAEKVPGIFYGPNMQQAVPFAVPSLELSKALRAGSNVLFTLKTDANSPLSGKTAMIKDEQFHPLSMKCTHVDLYEVRMDQKMKVSVPVILVGKAVGVAEGGIMQQSLRELEVVCLPADVPSKIEVKVDELKVGDSLHVSDLKLPSGVVVSSTVDYTVAACVPPEKEEVVAPAVAPGEVPLVGETPADGAAAAPGAAPGAAPAAAGAKGAAPGAAPAAAAGAKGAAPGAAPAAAPKGKGAEPAKAEKKK